MELITSRLIPMDGNGFIFSEAGKNGSEEAESWLQKRPHGSKVHLIKKLDGYDYDQYPPHVAY